jgi:hypothetical protein
MNMKKEEQVLACLKQVEEAGKVNVGSLLSRLEAARTTLDELKGATDRRRSSECIAGSTKGRNSEYWLRKWEYTTIIPIIRHFPD